MTATCLASDDRPDFTVAPRSFACVLRYSVTAKARTAEGVGEQHCKAFSPT